MAILEPDALGLLGDCGGQGERTKLLRFATKQLDRAGVWVYIDAGHSGWVKPHTMAKRLIQAGVGHARGFSVNVASFVRGDIERHYAKKIMKALRKRGVGDKHYVMDTSRNGGGQTNGNNWCNPLDARLGRAPQVVAGRKPRRLPVGEGSGRVRRPVQRRAVRRLSDRVRPAGRAPSSRSTTRRSC